MSSRNAGKLLQPGTLLITPGDRDDIIDLVLSDETRNGARSPLAGVVLTDGILPPEPVLQIIRERSLPFISTQLDISSATNAIGHMQVKTEVGDRDKIGAIQGLIHDHVDVKRLIELVRPGTEVSQLHLGV
jgi:BioD-like phosphotransacetylase family protein